MAGVWGFWKIDRADPITAYYFGLCWCRDYVDAWLPGVSITLWFHFDCWMLRLCRWGFSLGPLDVQWGD